jgi:hypothetical protein
VKKLRQSCGKQGGDHIDLRAHPPLLNSLRGSELWRVHRKRERERERERERGESRKDKERK